MVSDQFRMFKVINKGFVFPYVISIFLTIAASTLSAIAPLIFSYIIDSINQPLRPDIHSLSALQLVIIYLAIQLLSAGVRNIADYITATRSEYMSHQLRRLLLCKVFHKEKSHEYYYSLDFGKTLSLFVRDIEGLWDLFGYAITDLVSSVIMITALCLIVVSIDPILGGLLILTSLCFVGSFYWNGLRVRAHFAAAAPKFDKMLEFINSALRAYETIVSFRAQKWNNGIINLQSRNVTNLANKAHRRTTVFSFVTTLVNLTSVLAVWLLCLPSLLGGEQTYVDVTLGQFIAILTYFAIVMGPLEGISGSAKAIMKGFVSLERLSNFVNSAHDMLGIETDTPSLLHTKSKSHSGKLQASNLGYISKDKKEILVNVSFNVQPGEMIGIAGKSGSGKSTLLRVLARFHKPTKGVVLVNTYDVASYSEDEFRRRVRYIPQDGVIFPVDFEQNVTFGNPSGDLVRAMAAASGRNFIDRYKDSTDMASAGLSGGEVQRMALARAFYAPYEILLVDEPTSALDYTNSAKIYTTLQAIAASGAVIVASHDQHILELCTRVIVLEKGKVIAQDSHSILLNNLNEYISIISGHE